MLKEVSRKDMSKIKVRPSYVMALLLFLPVITNAQNEFIYVIKIKNCKSNPQCSRSQTGFRAARFNGALRITKVDIAHDVALLTSNATDGAPADGLEIAIEVTWGAIEKVNVIGRPLNLPANLPTELKLRRPQIVALRDLVPPNLAEKLLDRRSPDPDQDVVSISDTLLPGHSGAPILDSQNRVLGVANGGLEGGFAEICWAIPWAKVNLVDAQTSAGALARLARLDPASLFAFEGESSTIPELYRVRITVLNLQKIPIDDAKVISSLGGEVLKAPGGYQFEIPRAKRPTDGKVTFFGTKESAFLKGESGLVLGSDPSPAIIIRLDRDDSAVVRGVVVDEANNGVEGARVSVAGFENEAVVTKTGGDFVLPAHKAVGQIVLLRVEKVGYKSVTQSHPAGDEPVIIVIERKS
jgi:hypothetical protein